MNQIKKYFNKTQSIPIDIFFEKILYSKKFGYYTKINPFGKKGDFITAPSVSSLFGEMIAIWVIMQWQNLNNPSNFNVVELGPGDGTLSKILISTFKKFPNFFKSTNFFLYEKSENLKKIQKKKLAREKISWLSTFDEIKKGEVFFIGNEFFDAIPVKQFKRINGVLYERYVQIKKNLTVGYVSKKVPVQNITQINKYKTFGKSKFFEFPELGIKELEKIIKKINSLNGGLLLIDYGYLKQISKSTLQSVKNHKKNSIFKNLGKADVTSLVNFQFLQEYFKKKKLKVAKIVSQSTFLKKNGILERAEILSKNMNFTQKTDLYLRLKRILDKKFMGEIFKVIFVHKTKIKNPLGFE
jgi:NADH dehydrogenase [ubiquinone] 1 alpha subcomplex assembly factor 7